jgi:hypothetical protein
MCIVPHCDESLSAVQRIVAIHRVPGGNDDASPGRSFAPSEGRSSELEGIRGEAPLSIAIGSVIAGTVSGLFRGLLGLAAWLVI